ncbi:CHAT domain-containing tetratricopeptide repeat protein [Coleofasciculus sp. FACHB-SPT9]|uniref:CHAT domain-containing protein n=1 Tax=Cyanophyceae TaxID=3028117 RepID=UPI001683D88A|nr:CHAT domain-containing tetratricopeptide repeat protein [Coleofasciculus sp. FACHB-SPT9]MBD1889690.1 CHAT domain-containing protein [Coleofasciculus sp. FACHB-SPT9]
MRSQIGILAFLILVTTVAAPVLSEQIASFSRNQVLAQTTSSRKEEAVRLSVQSQIYYQNRQFNLALQSFEQVLKIYQEIQDSQGEISTLIWMGVIYIAKEGNYSKAIEYYQQALLVNRGIHNADKQNEAEILSFLGAAYLYSGNYSEAIEFFQQRLAIAKEAHNRLEEDSALNSLGVAYYRQGNYSTAIEYYQQASAISRETGEYLYHESNLYNLGFLFYKQGNLTAAEKTLFELIKVHEDFLTYSGNSLSISLQPDLTTIGAFENQLVSYRLLQQVLIAQNKLNVALEISERGRAREFVRILTNRLKGQLATEGSASLQASILTTPPTIRKLQQIAREQKATLIEYSIIYDFQLKDGHFRSEQDSKDEQETHELALYIWIIQPTGDVTFRQVDLRPLRKQQNTTLADLVTSSREAIGVRGRGLGVAARIDKPQQTNRLQQLHQLLIEPITDLLPQDPTSHVIFIPQESLFLVPFAALQDAAGKYLVEKHTILTAPAIQVLDLTHQQRQRVSGKDILVVGNPTMPQIGNPPQQLPSLPGAQREAVAIAQLFHTKAITGSRATKAAVLPLMSQARIVHLATHGLFDYYSDTELEGFNLPGAVALAPKGSHNGLLTATEILKKLKAELVVLSACDTGRGDITGDGVIGLSRALITAGAPSIMVSLWSVPDAPTASLMTEFYRQMQQKPDKAQALRQAMLITMKQYLDPKDWAAFTLIGEAE